MLGNLWDIFGNLIVHSISVELSNNDTCFISVSGIFDEDKIPSYFNFIFGGKIYTMYLSSVRSNGVVKILMYNSSEPQFSKEIIQKGLYFKTVYSGVKNILEQIDETKYADYILATETELIVKECDNPYLDGCGFTLQEILFALDIPAIIPFGLDYHIVEFRVPNGANKLAVIKSLIPIPFIKIDKIGGIYHISLLDNLYLKPYLTSGNFVDEIIKCGGSIHLKKLKDFKNTFVKGYKSTPINIKSSHTGKVVKVENEDKTAGITYIENTLGDKFIILEQYTKEETTGFPLLKNEEI
jgi:hypothetical protein